MTKLTINIDGKTFVPNGQFYFYESIYDWIKGGDLVELQPQGEKTEETKYEKCSFVSNAHEEKGTQPLISLAEGLEIRNGEVQYKPVEETQPSQPEEWTPKIGETIQVSDDMQKWMIGFYDGTSQDQEYPYRILDGSLWKFARPVSQPQPIEKLKNYELQDWYVNEKAGELHKHISHLTSTLNQVIERINNK